LIYYNAGEGCLASQYDGPIDKTFSIPVNVPDDAESSLITFTYRNTVENPSGPIEVSLWKRNYHYISETVEVQKFVLSDRGVGEHANYGTIPDDTYDTYNWLYWLEFKLPNGDATRQFCGVHIEYENPPLFPLALPMIQR